MSAANDLDAGGEEARSAVAIFMPRCDEAGNYELTQCTVFNGARMCSCVEPVTGRAFENSIRLMTGDDDVLDCSGSSSISMLTAFLLEKTCNTEKIPEIYSLAPTRV